MNTVSMDSIEILLKSSLSIVEAAFGKVKWSFEELTGCAIELAFAERTAQSSPCSVPEEDEDGNPLVNDALPLCEAANFDMTSALDRTLNELAEQERVLVHTRITLEQIRASLQLSNHELFPSTELGPKPGCACFTPRCGNK